MKNKIHNHNKIIIIIRQNWHILLLILFSLLMLVSVVKYGLRTQLYPIWDEQHYMRMATEFYRLLKHLVLSTPHEMLQIVPFRQPGYPLLIVPFYFLFGLSNAYFWALITNGILYVISIFGIYFISKLYLSRLVSFLSAILFSCYGWTLLHLHLSYSETAVSTFCILTILFLLRSDFFQKIKESLIFGIFLGLGMLMKWMTLVYVSGALLYVAYQIIRKRFFIKRVVLANIFISFLIAFLIIFYPYYTNFSWYFENWVSHQNGGSVWAITGEDQRNPFSIYSQTFYINTFMQLGIVYFVLLLIGLLLSFKKRSKLKPILVTFLMGYFFSVLAILKAERHIVPIFPYVAILSASVIDYIKNPLRKKIFTIFIVALSLLSFLGSFWGKGPMAQSLASFSLPFSLGQIDKVYLTSISSPPYIYTISGKEIIQYIDSDSKKSNIEDPQVLSLFYYRPLDEPLMSTNLYHMDKPMQINNLLGTIIQNPEKDARAFLQTTLINSDYVLIKNGKRTDSYFSEQNYVTLKALIALFDKHISLLSYYDKRKEVWIYQDSSIVTIYKKKNEIPASELENLSSLFIELLRK